MYNHVFFEISGVCNAKCKYCINGGKNSISGPYHRRGGGQIDVQEFDKAITYMYDSQIIGNSSLIWLYNWGEPFLHPKLKEIISVLKNKNLFFGLSTNASNPVYFNDSKCLSHLADIIFSMSGFSQQSYDRIHGFDFERIKSNIENMVMNYRENGFKGSVRIAYHIYQFNILEMSMAKDFAQKLNVAINFSAAYFNGYTMFRDYLMNNMGYANLKMACSELITYYINDILLKRPKDYVCPQWGGLTLDEYCNVLTCCCVDRLSENYSIGKLFELSPDDIKEKKLQQHICLECRQLGIDFLANNPLVWTIK